MTSERLFVFSGPLFVICKMGILIVPSSPGMIKMKDALHFFWKKVDINMAPCLAKGRC